MLANMETLRIQTVLHALPLNDFELWLRSALNSAERAQINTQIYIGVNQSSKISWECYSDLANRYNSNQNIFLIYTDKNIGHGNMHNLLFSHGIETNYLLICNPDGLLATDTISEFLSQAEIESFKVAFDARQVPFDHPKKYNLQTLECEWLSGSCLFLNWNDFKAVNGFDSRFFLHCDDIDLSLRLRNVGVTLKHLPTARFYHKKVVDANGYIKPSEKEPYYNKIGALLLADKWRNNKALNEMIRDLQNNGSELSKKILKEFDLQRNNFPKEADKYSKKLKYYGGWRFSETEY